MSDNSYYRIVDQALRLQQDQIISNGLPEHAAYAIRQFLANARSTVRIYSGRIARHFRGVAVYSDEGLVGAARVFLAKPSGRLLVVTQGGPDYDENGKHPLIEAAREMARAGNLNGELEVRQVTASARAYFREAEFDHHWQLMDEQAYRLEHDTDRAKAHINFGTPDIAKALATLFDAALMPESTLVQRVTAG